jgi:hypothetical protein
MSSTKTSVISYNQEIEQQIPDEKINLKTIKANFELAKKEIHYTKKIRNTNPNVSYFPSFYKKELKHSFINFVSAAVLLFLVFVASGISL